MKKSVHEVVELAILIVIVSALLVVCLLTGYASWDRAVTSFPLATMVWFRL